MGNILSKGLIFSAALFLWFLTCPAKTYGPCLVMGHINMWHIRIYLTNCMEISPWEGNSYWSAQEILRLLWKTIVHCYVCKCLTFVCILSQKNLLHNLSPASLRFIPIFCNVTLSPMVSSLQVSHMTCMNLFSPMRATRLAHPTLDTVSLIPFSDESNTIRLYNNLILEDDVMMAVEVRD